MRYQSMRIKVVVMIGTCLFIVATACKKATIEVAIDAFEKMQPAVVHQQGVYIVQFSLAEYPYKEVRLKLSTQKSLLHRNIDVKTLNVSSAGGNMFHVFINKLAPNTTYHYQIVVIDSVSEKEVYSDVYSFKTNP